MVIYMIVLIYFLLFSGELGRQNTGDGYHYNLIPFLEIKRFAVHWDKVGVFASILNLVGNVLAFVPYGLLKSMITGKSTTFIQILFQTLRISLGLECMQLFFQCGSFDVDDIILNVVGGGFGYVIYYLYNMGREENA